MVIETLITLRYFYSSITPSSSPSPLTFFHSSNHTNLFHIQRRSTAAKTTLQKCSTSLKFSPIRCIGNPDQPILKTCKNCKTQFDPSLNHPRACRFHTSHFGGETKRKFESVHTGGTMNTPDGGEVLQYWHCCGSEDPFDYGCTAAPHSSYDDW